MDAKTISPRSPVFQRLHMGSLQARFLRSHLSVAFIGICALFIAVLTIGFLGKNARDLAYEQGPTAQSSLKILNGIQVSLAAMRGWVALGDPEFRQQRQQAWSKLIYPNLENLKRSYKTDELQIITVALADLNEAQWWIEDVAQTPGNEPARALYTEVTAPLKQNIVQTINSMIDLIKNESQTEKKYFLLDSLYYMRLQFTKSFSSLGLYLETTENHYKLEHVESLQLTNQYYFRIEQENIEFSADMQELMLFTDNELIAYKKLAQKILILRDKEDWNVAQYLLKNDAIPTAKTLMHALNNISRQHSQDMQEQASKVGMISWLAIILVSLLLFVIATVAIIISRRNSKQLIDPIESLVDATQKLAKGSLGSNMLSSSGIDELDNLIVSFNRMHIDLSISRKELENTNQSLEEKIEERTAALQRSNEELEQFAYVASHDLQEPLRTVASFTELLRKRYKGKLDKDADEYIDFAIDGAKRMQALIQDLLEFSRIGTNKRALQAINSQDIYDVAIKNLTLAIEEKNAVIVTHGLPVVMGDERQLVQLFQNLIANAIKFQKPTESPIVEINAELIDTKWQFSVKDNGIGISQSNKQNIFQIFKRLHGRSEYEGTGIGLSVCKKIVESHGGSIWIESTEGVGTTFLFTLVQTSSPWVSSDLDKSDSKQTCIA